MIILLGQTKGGVGKSVLAANLAVALAHKGSKVLLIDADRQATSTKWGSMRTLEGHSPEVLVAGIQAEDDTATAFREKVLALKDRFDDVVIDCGGFDSRELRASVTLADVLIAPVAPSLPDLWALQDLDAIVGQLSVANPDMQAKIVINRAPSLNFYHGLEQAEDAMNELKNLSFSGVVISDRPRIQNCYQQGQGVFDLPDSNASAVKAQDEITKLYNLVK